MIVDAGELNDEEVVSAIEAALVAELDIHPSQLDVSYDRETGEVVYEITSDDIDSVNDAIAIIADEGFVSNLDVADEIVIESIETPVDVMVTVDIVVDASNISDPDSAITSVTQSIEDRDASFEVVANGAATVLAIGLGRGAALAQSGVVLVAQSVLCGARARSALPE